jgi:hypothetical protein
LVAVGYGNRQRQLGPNPTASGENRVAKSLSQLWWAFLGDNIYCCLER